VTPGQSALCQLDALFRERAGDLFSSRIVDRLVEVKARRTHARRCRNCGRRGYCVSVCQLRDLRGTSSRFELELVWVYAARCVFSSGVHAPRGLSGSRTLVKGGRVM
jgi:ferredoxin